MATHERSPLLFGAGDDAAPRTRFFRVILGGAACAGLAVVAVAGLRGVDGASFLPSRLGAGLLGDDDALGDASGELLSGGDGTMTRILDSTTAELQDGAMMMDPDGSGNEGVGKVPTNIPFDADPLTAEENELMGEVEAKENGDADALSFSGSDGLEWPGSDIDSDVDIGTGGSDSAPAAYEQPAPKAAVAVETPTPTEKAVDDFHAAAEPSDSAAPATASPDISSSTSGSSGSGDFWIMPQETMDELVAEIKPAVAFESPPAPEAPPFPEKLTPESIIVSKEDSTIKAEFKPKNPFELPEPLKEGNDVVAVPVTNVPPRGFLEEEMDLLLQNKGRNAGLKPKDLKTRALYYAAVDSFNLTNAHCGPHDSLMRALTPMLKQSFNASHEEGRMNVTVDAVAFGSCIESPRPRKSSYPEWYVPVSSVNLMFMSAVNREKIAGKEQLQKFMVDSSRVIRAGGFHAMMQKTLYERVDAYDGQFDAVKILTTWLPRLIGFVIIEGPPGSGEALLKTNGPIMAS